MSDFLGQFGIDWKLFVSQLVNFALILIILRLFVYKPLVKILNKRRDKIQEGLAKAEEASVRLKEVDVIAKNKLKETDEKCVALLSEIDVKKQELEREIIANAKKKEEELMKRAEVATENQKRQMYEKIQSEAAEIIKNAIAKGVSEAPESIDKKLISKTVSALENEL